MDDLNFPFLFICSLVQKALRIRTSVKHNSAKHRETTSGIIIDFSSANANDRGNRYVMIRDIKQRRGVD